MAKVKLETYISAKSRPFAGVDSLGPIQFMHEGKLLEGSYAVKEKLVMNDEVRGYVIEIEGNPSEKADAKLEAKARKEVVNG